LSFTAQQSRVDALIRLVGLIVIVFGGALVYYTYANSTDPNMAGPLVTVYYALGVLLLVVGLVAAFSKFK
jgi:vacuolar-type H+-ATPase subunit I/STV1